MRIAPAAWDELRWHGEQDYPYESCGVLLGHARDGERRVVGVARCANVHPDSPRNRYAIDPREVVRVERVATARGEDIVGFYHSHPDHPARPSPTDLAEAHWFGCSYVITSVDAGRAGPTRAFVLDGDGEHSKRFQDEEILKAEP